MPKKLQVKLTKWERERRKWDKIQIINFVILH